MRNSLCVVSGGIDAWDSHDMFISLTSHIVVISFTSHTIESRLSNDDEDKTGTPLANATHGPKKENENRVIPPCNHNHFVRIYLSMYEK
jgi:hypothetical protein